MKEDTLTDMVSAMKEKVGLVHQMPFACDRKGFAGVLEKVGILTVITACRRTHISTFNISPAD